MSLLAALLLDEVDLGCEFPASVLLDPDHQQRMADVAGPGERLQAALSIELRLGQSDLQVRRVSSVSGRGHL